MKNYRCFVYLLIFISSLSYAQVHVLSFNSRFLWIEVPSKFVNVRLSHPKNGESLCWIEVKTHKEYFDFISRRTLPYEECLFIVESSRKILRENASVKIYGNGGMRHSKNNYFGMWDMIRGEKGCVGYFGDFCSQYPQMFPEYLDYVKSPIDPKLYP